MQVKAKNLSKNPFALLKASAAPKPIPCMANTQGEVATWLGEKRMLMPHKMEDEELSNLYEDLKVVLESLQDVEEYFSCKFLHDLNS